jgi:predicted  nucleic acid-binding Zn-ribbon protein
MQMLEDELQNTNEKITRVKDSIKERTVKMDSLRSEKAKLEKSVSAHKIEVDDGRAAKLCERYVLQHCSRTFDQIELGIHRSWRCTDRSSTCDRPG